MDVRALLISSKDWKRTDTLYTGQTDAKAAGTTGKSWPRDLVQGAYPLYASVCLSVKCQS